MFTVVVKQNENLKTDPLIIKEDINNIIQSIEEQLYNINSSYRNIVREIKNSIKKLNKVGLVSTNIFLEEELVDERIVPYVTNVLEITLDCVLVDLLADPNYRIQIENINTFSELLEIDHANIEIFQEIVTNTQKLLEVYSEVTESECDKKLFYQILDSVIENSQRNKSNVEIKLDRQTILENTIYEEVLNNLDELIDNRLDLSYNNIKQFSANCALNRKDKSIYEMVAYSNGFSDSFLIKENAVLNLLSGAAKLIFRRKAPAAAAAAAADPMNKPIVYSLLGIFALINAPAILSSLWSIIKSIYKFFFDPDNNVSFRKSYERLVSSDLENLTPSNVLDTYNRLSIVTKDDNVPVEIRSSLLASFQKKLATVASEIQTRSDNMETSIQQYNAMVSSLEQRAATLTSELEDKQKYFRELDKQINFKEFFFGGRIPGIHILFALTGFVAGSMFFLVLIKNMKESFPMRTTFFHMYDTKTKLQKSIKLVIADSEYNRFAQNQMDILDDEIQKCEMTSVRVGDAAKLYECAILHLFGMFGILIYIVLDSIQKDGTDINKIKNMGELLNYTGFASLKTRLNIKNLNEIYKKFIELDSQLVRNMEYIFVTIKNEVLKKSNKINYNALPKTLTSRTGD